MEKVEENAGEAVEPTEEESTEESSEDESTEHSDDPLDAIEDEEARNEAKRLRAIENRRKRREEEGHSQEEESASAPSPSNYATKDDLKRLATNDAKKLVAPEVREAWDELTAIPLGGFDPLDSESIAENMAQRFTLYQTQNAGEDPSKSLRESDAEPASIGGGRPQKTEKKVDLPGYKEPVQPTEWYPEKD